MVADRRSPPRHRPSRGGVRRAGRLIATGAGRDRRRPRSSAASGAVGRCSAGRTVSPLNIPAWRDFPLHERLTGRDRAAGRRRQRRQGAGSRRGMARRGPGRRQLSGHGGVHRCRWWHRARRPVARRRLGNAGHIGHVVVEPDGRRCACGGRGCLEAEASGTVHRRHHRTARRRGPADGAPSHRDAGRPGGGLGGQPVGPRAGGGGRLGGPRVRGGRSSTPPKRRSSAGPVSISPARPGSSRPASVPTGRWSGRRRSGRRALRRCRLGRAPGEPGDAAVDRRRRRGRMVAVAPAVLRRPELWWTALGAVARLARPGWWRRRRYLPLPDRRLWALPDGHRLREPRRRSRPRRRDRLPRMVPGRRPPGHRRGRGQPGSQVAWMSTRSG